jgi:succinate-semialdehyde dehydrogenase / glutarate-semialdehyde dehydrogenase
MTSNVRTNAHDELLESLNRQLFIGGRWIPAHDGALMPVINPATANELTTVSDGGAEDGHAALCAAAVADADWRRTPPRVRSEILTRARELVIVNADSLATVMTLEMGKPLPEARGEVMYAAEFLRWFAEEAVRIEGSFSITPDGATRAVVSPVAVGPCLLITPWNFPLAMAARKVAPALAAGCTVVLKPAPQTPLSALCFASILEQAGLPDGVLNVISTSRAAEVCAPMWGDPALRKLSFTGSTDVGKVLLAEAATSVIRTSMELGGNAPFIVFDDADLDVAVESAMQAKMRNMGEACTAGNRFFVHERVMSEFADRFATRMDALTVGPGVASGTDVGPLIDAESLAKVERLVDDAIARGGRRVTRRGVGASDGYFYPPTVLVDVDPDSDMCHTEIFGPVAALQSFTDDDDVIAAANATPWGLVAYVFTQDVDRAQSVSDALEVGMVGLNSGIVSNPAMPFGGVKQSGLGREGGRLGIDEYVEYKLISSPVRTR